MFTLLRDTASILFLLILAALEAHAKPIAHYKLSFRMGPPPEPHFSTKIELWGWNCEASVIGITEESVLLPDGSKDTRELTYEKRIQSPWVFGKTVEEELERDLSTMGMSGTAKFSVTCQKVNLNIIGSTSASSSKRIIDWTCKIPTIPMLAGASIETSCENTPPPRVGTLSYEGPELYQYQALPMSVKWELVSKEDRADLDLCQDSEPHGNRMKLLVLQGLNGFQLEHSYFVTLQIGNLNPVVIHSKDGVFSSEISICPENQYVKIAAHGYEQGNLFLADYGSGEITLGPYQPDNWGKIHMRRLTSVPGYPTLESDLLFVLMK